VHSEGPELNRLHGLRAQKNFRFAIRAVMLIGGIIFGAQLAAWIFGLFVADNTGEATREKYSQVDVRSVPREAIRVSFYDTYPDGNLDAIWLLSSSDNTTLIRLIGVPVSAANAVTTPIVGEIVLDHTSVSRLLERVEPLRIGGEEQSGTAIIDFILQGETEAERLYRQAAVLQAFIASATTSMSPPELIDAFAKAHTDAKGGEMLRMLLSRQTHLRVNSFEIDIYDPVTKK